MTNNGIDKKSNKLEYKNYMNSLFDLYSCLLTEKQIEYFKYYYFLDYSLREIASIYNVSSNAIYDQISNIESSLERYEECLHLNELNSKRCDLIDKLEFDTSKINDLIENIDNEELRDAFNNLLKDLKDIKQLEEME